MRMFLDDVIQIMIIILLLALVYTIGYERSESKHCNASGGKYSFDYGECRDEKK